MGSSGRPHFHDEKYGAAIGVVCKDNSKFNRIRKIDRAGTVFIDLVAGITGDLDQRLKIYLASITSLAISDIEVMGGGATEKRLVLFMGISASRLEAILKSARSQTNHHP